MPNFRDLFITIHPFSSTLLPLLNVWDTVSLMQTCRGINFHLRHNSAAFNYVDLRDERAAAALTRLLADNQTPLTRFYYASLDTSRHRRIFLPSIALQTLVLQRRVRIRVLLLDGLQITDWLLKEVLKVIAPTLEELSLVFTLGCKIGELAEMFGDLKLGRQFKKLRIWGMGEGFPRRLPHNITFQSWNDNVLRQLESAAESKGIKLDATLCPVEAHMWNRYTMFKERTCKICGKVGREMQCYDQLTPCRDSTTCLMCDSFYCGKCLHSLGFPGDAESPAVWQVCPWCDEADKLKECAGCGDGWIFGRRKEPTESNDKVRIQKRGDCAPCSGLCHEWRCDNCFDPAKEFQCDNCWNVVCLPCVLKMSWDAYSAQYPNPTRTVMRLLYKAYPPFCPTYRLHGYSGSNAGSNGDGSAEGEGIENSNEQKDEEDEDEEMGEDQEGVEYEGSDYDSETDTIPDANSEDIDLETLLKAWLHLHDSIANGIATVHEATTAFPIAVWKLLITLLEGGICASCNQGFLCTECKNGGSRICPECTRPVYVWNEFPVDDDEDSDEFPDAMLIPGEVERLRDG